MKRFAMGVLVAAFCLSPFSHAQSEPGGSYSRSNTFSVFTEFSNDSSHIILGRAANRKLVALGASYSRRILVNHVFEWQYGVEIRPLVLLRQPTVLSSVTASFNNGLPPITLTAARVPLLQSCTSGTQPLGSSGNIVLTLSAVCGNQWTYAGGISPLGQRLNFAPHHRIQPFITENAGFLVAPRDIPVNDSSRFNFTFEFGAGVELYRERERSVALEYCVHLRSNAAI